MFDLLAIDWGKKRIGMAFGSLETKLILPFDLDLNWFNFWQILEIQLKNRQIKKIILGMPVNFELGKTKTGTQIETFLENLQEFLDEIFLEINLKSGGQNKNNEKNIDNFNSFKENTQNMEQELEEKPKSQSDNQNNTKKTLPNIQKSKFVNKIEKPEVIIINERNSSQMSQNFEIIQENDSKSGFRNWQKTNQKQNQKWEISKSNLNHLAASQILSWYLESL